MDFEKDEKTTEDLIKKTAELWNDYIKLEMQHPNEPNEFANHIHGMQQILALRIARKYRPDIFPLKK